MVVIFVGLFVALLGFVWFWGLIFFFFKENIIGPENPKGHIPKFSEKLRDQKFSVEFVWTLGVLQYLIFEGEKTELTSAAEAEMSVRWF